MSTQETQERAEQDPFAEQRNNTAFDRAQRQAVAKQHEKVSKTKMNPGFYREIADLNIESEQYDWLENELGAKAAPGHILGKRPEEYVFQQMLLNRNQANRMITEGERGRLLKKNPVVDAVFQGLGGKQCVEWNEQTQRLTLTPTAHTNFAAPIESSAERRQFRDAMDLQTTRESLAVEGEALDALTKATTESVHRNERDEQETKAGRVASVLGR